MWFNGAIYYSNLQIQNYQIQSIFDTYFQCEYNAFKISTQRRKKKKKNHERKPCYLTINKATISTLTTQCSII